MGGRLPLDGETFSILAQSELTTSDTFKISITPPEILNDPELIKNGLKNIKVVPNPFIVNAAWEQIENNRRLRFMFLPAECTISIYTVSGE